MSEPSEHEYKGPERRRSTHLTDELIEEISESAAARAVEKLNDHPIAPPRLPSASEVAAMLPPMPVSSMLVMSYRRESDEAMRLALDCGVAINADYRFLTPHERPSNGY